jgi:hypothetical protein
MRPREEQRLQAAADDGLFQRAQITSRRCTLHAARTPRVRALPRLSIAFG